MLLPLPADAVTRSSPSCGSRWVAPTVMPRQKDYAMHLFRIERLRQNVVATEVEHLGPKRPVDKPGSDYYGGARIHTVDSAQKELPVAVRQIPLADHDGSVVFRDKGHCLMARGYLS